MKRLRVIFLMLLASLFVLSFQNCSSGFREGSSDLPSLYFGLESPTTLTESGGATPEPNPEPPDQSCVVQSISGGPVISNISSPMRMRVYQRTNGAADVPVHVGLSSSADCVQARVLRDDRTPLVPWTNIAKGSLAAGAQVTGTIATPNGGWYFVETRAVKANIAGPVAAVDFIGVGEVFVTAGQSNSSFFGSVQQRTKTGKVVYFDGSEWQICQDPLTRVDPQASGGATWCPLGDNIVGAWGVPVAFAATGWGGTSVSQWLPEAATSPGGPGVLFDRHKQMLRYFGPHGVRAVLWHQGESDVAQGTSGEAYAAMMRKLINGSRAGAGFQTPWLVSEVTYVGELSSLAAFCGAVLDCNQYVHDLRSQVLAGQRTLVDNVTIFTGLQSDNLMVPYRSDGVHFNELGLTTAAQQWFDKINLAFGH